MWMNGSKLKNMCAFENYRSEVTPFFKSAHILFALWLVVYSLCRDSHVVAECNDTITNNLSTRWSLSSCELMRVREVINLTIRVTGEKRECEKGREEERGEGERERERRERERVRKEGREGGREGGRREGGREGGRDGGREGEREGESEEGGRKGGREREGESREGEREREER